MPGYLEPDVLVVAAITAGFIVLVLLSVRVMRWAILRRHPEIVGSTNSGTTQLGDASAGGHALEPTAADLTRNTRGLPTDAGAGATAASA